MSYFKYYGKQVYYEEVGKGPLLFFLHGNTASGNMYYHLIPYFSDFHVVVPDFLGHGKSERLTEFPADFWYDQGRQVIALRKCFPEKTAILFGSSGGAQAALNAALEEPALFQCVIADSFEGEFAIPELLQGLEEQRALSLQDPSSIFFYQAMHGDEYEDIVHQDTEMMKHHFDEIGHYMHKDLSELQIPALLIGSKQDEMIVNLESYYQAMLKKSARLSMHLFDQGNHPACLSNLEESADVVRKYLKKMVTY